ncbi:BUD13 homolog [Ctenocephalides felis]|uniref:BUD13 homolog n=1 Tax=Ctenocephalides felis TaxID=7515 RepID=UPI000E6E3E40|nr:BUD13 homolog [Ctenocephalides felis]
MPKQKLSQKEYLKKYLSKSDGTKPKKKKKRSKTTGEGLKIVDDDEIAPANGAQFSEEVQLDLLLADEDAPQVAEFIDESKVLARTTANWKTVTDSKLSDDRWGKKSYPDIKVDDDLNLSRRISDKNSSNKYSLNQDLEDDLKKKKNSFSDDMSPPRKSRAKDHLTPPRRHRESPNRSISKNSDNDLSPTRKSHSRTHDKDESSKYKYRDKGNSSKKSNKSDHDLSPQRRSEYNKASNLSKKFISKIHEKKEFSKLEQNEENERKNSSKDNLGGKKNHYSDLDLSPKRKYRSNSEIDLSPPGGSESKSSHKNKNKSDSVHDLSPPRKYNSNKCDKDLEHNEYKIRESNHRNKYSEKSRSTYAENMSPRRSNDFKFGGNNYNHKFSNRSTGSRHERVNSRRNSSDTDQSPPRRSRDYEKISRKSKSNCNDRDNSRERYSDTDQSPPRKSKRENDQTSSEKMKKTLDGKIAGLQDAKSLRIETERIRKKEKDQLLNMNDEISGRYAKTVSRKSGRKEESEDEDTKKARLERERIHKEKYSRWGKGLKQVEELKSRMEEDLHEMNKPLARYANDDDLDKHLRDRLHADDPMLEYIQQKQMEKNVKKGIQVRPEYKGAYPSNRFDIKPGYRWDGVDRGNGYEKQWFEKMNAKKADEDEAYKWSTEDM